jgi:hypothetical protein
MVLNVCVKAFLYFVVVVCCIQYNYVPYVDMDLSLGDLLYLMDSRMCFADHILLTVRRNPSRMQCAAESF